MKHTIATACLGKNISLTPLPSPFPFNEAILMHISYLGNSLNCWYGHIVEFELQMIYVTMASLHVVDVIDM